MNYVKDYDSPLGKILIACDDEGLSGLWFYGGSDFARGLTAERVSKSHLVIEQAEKWLDEYFSGHVPGFTPPLHAQGTEFQRKVWNILLTIPYGHTRTYGDIARQISPTASARAVGSAVGRNDICIIIPCHRVIGSDGSLTGYGGGIDRKEGLLRLEGANFKHK